MIEAKVEIDMRAAKKDRYLEEFNRPVPIMHRSVTICFLNFSILAGDDFRDLALTSSRALTGTRESQY